VHDATDLLTALRDVGVATPAVGDAGDGRVRSALEREIGGRRRFGRRIRLPFSIGSITLMPAALLVGVAAAAAATTLSLLHANPATLFEHNPQVWGQHETAIPSTIRKLATVDVPGVGAIQYWVAETEQHGRCWGLRGPNGAWLTLAMNDRSAGSVPGCGPTRKQLVLAQGNSSVGLMPMSVDYLANSVTGATGQTWQIYYGTVDANNAVAVRDLSTGKTAPLIDGRYFLLVERQTTNCSGCGQGLRAISATGEVLPANYGPERYRNH
jgi:hypothetical protein